MFVSLFCFLNKSDNLSRAVPLLKSSQKEKWDPTVSLHRPTAMQPHPVFAKLEKSHLTDDSVKTRGYFSNAIEPMVGGSAFTRMSLAKIAIASSFTRASVPEKQCSMYFRKHGRKC